MNPARALPERLGKYQIVRLIGAGGMGVVYEGFDPLIRRRVALKAIKRDVADDESLLARFRREAEAAGRLAHPRIVTVYDYSEDVSIGPDGQEERTPFIAMEFVQGVELRSLMEEKATAGERLPLPQVRQIISGLLEALIFSHEQRVVHRDIKPANIMVLSDGNVKVTDFGIAQLLEVRQSTKLTQYGSVLGTLSYMAPEQFMGEVVDGRTDLYAAGVVLYELLTGTVPFVGTTQAVMYKVLNDQPVLPSLLSLNVPPAYDAVIARALAKRPGDRFQSATEFRRALPRPQSARPQSVREQAPRHQAPEAPRPPGGGAGPAARMLSATRQRIRVHVARTLEVARRLTRRRPHTPIKPLLSQLAISLGVLVAALGAVAAYNAFLSGHSATSTEPGSTQTVQPSAHNLPAQTVQDCPDCPAMVEIPPGSFKMGSPESEEERANDESPAHDVHIAYPFWVSESPITRAQWKYFVNQLHHQDDSDCLEGQQQDHPVVCVSWEDAQDYVHWLKRTTGRPYRLLSESEYEYVNRAGSQTVYFWGDSTSDMHLYTRPRQRYEDLKVTWPVKSYQPNAFHLYDTTGSVSSWTQDCYHNNYNAAPADGRSWDEGDCTAGHVVRGGAWLYDPTKLRAAYRFESGHESTDDGIGFRVARDCQPSDADTRRTGCT